MKPTREVVWDIVRAGEAANKYPEDMLDSTERIIEDRDAEVRAETIEECEMATGMDLRLLLHARSLAAKSKP